MVGVDKRSIGDLVRSQVALSAFTTFRVGGPAEWFATPRTFEQLEQSLRWARAQALAVTVIGAGSNLLVSDQGLDGLVICTRHLRQSTFDEASGQVTAAAGEPLPTLAWKAAKRGWRGLEWAVGIPGTLGGAVVMNAGAHGCCLADRLVSVQVLDESDRPTALTPENLAFAYRASRLQKRPRPVLAATLQLFPGYDPQAVLADTLADLEQRRATQPYDMPSCGSVFRNPPTHSAGWLIEQTGLKGYRLGNAQVAQRHANFILNCGGATAMDIFQLIRYIQAQVETRWSLCLQPEVRLLGSFLV